MKLEIFHQTYQEPNCLRGMSVEKWDLKERNREMKLEIFHQTNQEPNCLPGMSMEKWDLKSYNSEFMFNVPPIAKV